MLPDLPKSRRALLREATQHARRNRLALTPAEIRLVVSGYQSSGEADTRTLSRWLEIKCADPTARTAVERAVLADPKGSAQRRRAHFASGGGR